ncbi:MAG: peptidylprolyl isomerase [Oscillospiraceae bacterium]|nr:peptidylprolyl isomerase [Oscillospiraceae bacterium]
MVFTGCGEKDPIPSQGKNPIATIKLEDGGVIEVELYPDKAPNTVNNFISLAKSGYYDGKTFHRAMPGFMIQGGSPNGDGLSTGFPYSIKAEFAVAGFTQNDISHTPGVISMARLQSSYDSASTQFFIMHGVADYLDGSYAAFGMVTTGMDVVDAIANSPCDGQFLIQQPVIKSITVETFGVNYPEPETIPVNG